MNKSKTTLFYIWQYVWICLMMVVQETPVQAQHTQKSTSFSDSIFAIQEITITARNTPKDIIPMQSLTGKELKTLSVYSVADAIRYFSGAQVKDYGGIGGLKTVNVRSMGSHHVGVFYDGVELGNAQNGVVDLGRFSLDNMEAVSLYNGQKSSILQPAKDYASASAIYMVTKKPIFEQGKSYNFNIGLKGGSFTTVNPSLLWEQKLTSRSSLSVSTEFLSTSGKYKFSYAKENGYDTTEVRKNGDVRMFRAEAAAFGKVKNGEWKTKVYIYNSERGYPGASVREQPGVFKNQDRQWDTNFFTQGSYKQSFTSFYSLLINAKYAYDYLHYLSDPRLDVSTMYVDNNYKQQETYLSAAHLFSINPYWNISIANDYLWNTLNANVVDFVYPSRHTLLSALSSSIEVSRWKLQASLLHTFVKDKTNINGEQAVNKSIFSPAVITSLQPWEDIDLMLRAFYKRVFRMPTLNDLYYTVIGNKYLDPEYTTQYNIGLTYSKQWHRQGLTSLSFQLDGYFNQIDNKIIAMPTSNQFRWTMLNLGYVEIKGIDAAINAQLKWNQFTIEPRLSYTFQKAQDFTDKTSQWYGGQIPYIPWHSGSALLNLSYKSWSLHYSFIYTGERYEAIANIPENYSQPWYTHDVSVSKFFDLKKCKLQATVEINNLLNQQYEVVQCYPMPGTNFKLKLNIHI